MTWRAFFAGAFMALAFLASPAGQALASSCHEDEPCWNWTQHGNGARGVVLTDGRRVTVSTCAFQRRWYGRSIDRSATPRLRGDGWARRFGCGFDVQQY